MLTNLLEDFASGESAAIHSGAVIGDGEAVVVGPPRWWASFGVGSSESQNALLAREKCPVVKLRVRAGESIQEAVRRFRKLCERSGLRKEMRRKAYYEKPSERRRREELKRLRKARQHQTTSRV